ncbi:2-C-methyl-D-erythritol 2,4-cyclodiphosphate synthase [Eubacteriaceae bacterium CHKCI005]|nr:2-C-methyl-D-erythritol 2,4-cyclodiphosphate synthase [Eubacteriaceae bacterium CHKCI005]
MRIGHGYDVHRLVEGRPLIVGGVEIPYEKGLLGHSDADVLLHAIADALLGSVGLGDIGLHFPDTDARFKDADSSLLLEHVVQLLRERTYRVGNIDATIVAQCPKMRPYIQQMRDNVANICGVEADQVNIKATTEEGLGFTGRGEAVAAHAVCLVEEMK